MIVKRILISRTDSIGDVMLTLPLCGLLKKKYPEAILLFMGSSYTKPIVAACAQVDVFVDCTALELLSLAEQAKAIEALEADCIVHVFPRKGIARLAKQAGIPLRIGTTNRLYHWFTCNKLVKLSRKNSPLHESQLNVQLAACLLDRTDYTIDELWPYVGFTKALPLAAPFDGYIDNTRFNLIIHPKSKGSAREWPLDKYTALIKSLPAERFKIFVSGTAEEGRLLSEWLKSLGGSVTDITGQMNLTTFIGFINSCDGLIAASTGPLHVAAALGKHALGFYPPIRPMHPGRWQAIGAKAEFITIEKDCVVCKGQPGQCACIKAIDVLTVSEKIKSWLPA